MAWATLRISGPMLSELLHLPEGTRVADTEFLVFHDDIPVGTEYVTPQYRRNPEVTFEEWKPEPWPSTTAF